MEKLRDGYKMDAQEHQTLVDAITYGLLSAVSCDWCHDVEDWSKNPSIAYDGEGVTGQCQLCHKSNLLTWSSLQDAIEILKS